MRGRNDEIASRVAVKDDVSAVVRLQRPVHAAQRPELVLQLYQYLLYARNHIDWFDGAPFEYLNRVVDASRSRADMLPDAASAQLDSVAAWLRTHSERRVFHLLGCGSAYSGVREVWTVSFDANDENDSSVAAVGPLTGKENTAWADTHAAGARLIRAVIEADCPHTAAPKLLVLVEHADDSAPVQPDAAVLLRHNPMDKTSVTLRVHLHVTAAADAVPPAAAPYAAAQLFACSRPLALK